MSMRHSRPRIAAHARSIGRYQRPHSLHHFAKLSVAIAVMCGQLCVATWPLRASDPPSKINLANKPGRMLIVRGGRILEGDIRRAAGGYIVEVNRGSMFVPFEHVQFEANSKSEAYRKLRKSMPDLNANNHIALARWCMSNQQLQAAQTELSDALALEPSRQDARDMLKRLENLLKPHTATHLQLPRPAPRTDDGFLSREVKSLSGLPRDLAQSYVLRIQPLLLNKCGNARCHGGESAGKFRLQQRHGISRITTERNLASMLQLINDDDPDQSPLLVVPQGNHARGGRSVFFGRSGTGQIRSIRDWIRKYVEHQTQSSQSQELANKPSRNAQPTRVAAASIPAQSTPTERSAAPVPDVANPPTDKHTRGRELIDAVLKAERPDAFDPDDFNRRQQSGVRQSTRSTHGQMVRPQVQRYPSFSAPNTTQRQRPVRGFTFGHSLPSRPRPQNPNAVSQLRSPLGDLPQAQESPSSRNRLLVPEALWNRQRPPNALNSPGGSQQ